MSEIENKVIIIEPQKAVGDVISTALGIDGLSHIHYTDIGQALDAINQKGSGRIRCLITAYELEGGVNGLEVVKEVNKIAGNKGPVPTVMYTGSYHFLSPEDRRLIRSTGIHVLKPKPFRPSLISQDIAQAIELAQKFARKA